MEWREPNKDRLPQDAAVEQPGMASFASLDLALSVSWPITSENFKRKTFYKRSTP